MRPKYRSHVEPMEPDMATARIRGLAILYQEGAPVEELWGYSATGQPRRFGSPYMLGDWDAAIADLNETFPDGATREQAKTEAVRRLRAISIMGVA